MSLKATTNHVDFLSNGFKIKTHLCGMNNATETCAFIVHVGRRAHIQLVQSTVQRKINTRKEHIMKVSVVEC